MTQKLVEILMRCGFIRIRAIVLAQLIRTGKNTAREIERECDLRQPEVSLALSYFIERGWVTVSHLGTEIVRGRPTFIYTLVTPEQVYQDIQKEQSVQIKQIQDTLHELKTAMTSVKKSVSPPDEQQKQQSLIS